jgi:transcriptional regulator with XRE-family HTH domain
MTIVSVPFGQLLYEKIHASGMSAPEFAERVGLAKSTVSKVKSGRILPNPETINRWITQLKLTDIEAAEFRQAAAEAHVPDAFLSDIRQLRAANRRLIDLVAHRTDEPLPLPRDKAMTPDQLLAELSNMRRVNRALLDRLDIAEGRAKRPKLTGVDHIPETDP